MASEEKGYAERIGVVVEEVNAAWYQYASGSSMSTKITSTGPSREMRGPRRAERLNLTTVGMAVRVGEELKARDGQNQVSRKEGKHRAGWRACETTEKNTRTRAELSGTGASGDQRGNRMRRKRAYRTDGNRVQAILSVHR